MEDLSIYEAILKLKREGGAAVLATVVDSSGSTPRKPGAKMLIHSDGRTVGSIGGGRVEAEMAESAREILREGRPKTAEYLLDERSGLVCGGRMLLYLEPLLPSPRLLIVGKGHIGQALDSLARQSGYSVCSFEPPVLSATDGESASVEDLRRALKKAAAGTDSPVVIATPSHPQDFSACLSALESGASFIGMVGSRRKRQALESYLADRGIAEADRARIASPVGLQIGAETPAEIAVSILAQLIERRRTDAAERTGHSARRGEIQSHGAKQAASPPG